MFTNRSEVVWSLRTVDSVQRSKSWGDARAASQEKNSILISRRRERRGPSDLVCNAPRGRQSRRPPRGAPLWIWWIYGSNKRTDAHWPRRAGGAKYAFKSQPTARTNNFLIISIDLPRDVTAVTGGRWYDAAALSHSHARPGCQHYRMTRETPLWPANLCWILSTV